MRLGFRARTCENGGMKRLAKKKERSFPPFPFRMQWETVRFRLLREHGLVKRKLQDLVDMKKDFFPSAETGARKGEVKIGIKCGASERLTSWWLILYLHRVNW